MKLSISAVSAILAAAVVAVPAPQASGITQCASASNDRINVLAGELTTLIGQVSSFQASTFSDIGPLLKIQTGAMQLSDSIQQANTQIGSCQNFDDVDTASVAATLLQIVPSIKSVLNGIVGKKDQFDKAILGIASAGFIVEADLVRLKNVTDTLASTLQSKSSDILGNALKDLVSEIDGWFTNGVNAFANDPIISL